MGKIKQWLRRWLGVEEDKEEFQRFKKYMYGVDTDHARREKHIDNRVGKLEDIIGKTIRAGFDHHLKQPSWIVLSWREKNGREHVHFYEVKQDNLDSILYTLKTLQRDNVIIDTHPQIAPHFKL